MTKPQATLYWHTSYRRESNNVIRSSKRQLIMKLVMSGCHTHTRTHTWIKNGSVCATHQRKKKLRAFFFWDLRRDEFNFFSMSRPKTVPSLRETPKNPFAFEARPRLTITNDGASDKNNNNYDSKKKKKEGVNRASSKSKDGEQWPGEMSCH